MASPADQPAPPPRARRRRFATAFVIILGILALGHFYVWTRLILQPQLPSPWFAIATAAIVALAVAQPMRFMTMRRMPRAQALPFAWIVFGWLGTSLYVLLLTALSDGIRLGAWIAGALPEDPVAALALRRDTAAAIAIGAAAIAGFGMWWANKTPAIRRVRVPLAKLPASASGYVIAHLSDVHIGPTLGRAFCERVVAAVNALAPDLVVITGDLIDGSLDDLRDHIAPLADLRAKDGVYFATGNHEYYWDANRWLAHLATLGVRVLRNTRVVIRDAFELAGADDSTSASMLPDHGEDIEAAVRGRNAALPLVLLAHHPSSAPLAVAAGVDLQLSGHVHAGQLWPMHQVAKLREPYIHGLYRLDPGSWLYVSAGTGYWGPPMRVGTTAEIARIELVHAD